MSHHFVQQLIHVMWATQDQKYTLSDTIRNELYAYVSRVIKSKEGHLLLADGDFDHIHCLISLPPTISLSNMMQFIKGSSSKWIKSKIEMDQKFCWQNGYAAISLQEDRKESVYSYIKKDKERHRTINYRSELQKILNMQNISIDEKYLLETTYSKVFVHFIWSTKNRIPYLEKSMRTSLYTEITRVSSEIKGVVHAIGGIEDHVHLLMEVPKDKALSDLIRDIKSAGTQLLRKKILSFEWQTGFVAFSISLSTLDKVKQYIQNQEEHHKSKTTMNEWHEFLTKKGLLIS